MLIIASEKLIILSWLTNQVNSPVLLFNRLYSSFPRKSSKPNPAGNLKQGRKEQQRGGGGGGGGRWEKQWITSTAVHNHSRRRRLSHRRRTSPCRGGQPGLPPSSCRIWATASIPTLLGVSLCFSLSLLPCLLSFITHAFFFFTFSFLK